VSEMKPERPRAHRAAQQTTEYGGGGDQDRGAVPVSEMKPERPRAHRAVQQTTEHGGGGETQAQTVRILPPPPPRHIVSPTAFSSDNFFYLCSLHIGNRQEALPKFQGDLEAVASPRGSSQLGGYPAIFCAVRFLYRVSTGDCSEIIGPGWHLSSPGQT
jgi:hypothetical protein